MTASLDPMTCPQRQEQVALEGMTVLHVWLLSDERCQLHGHSWELSLMKLQRQAA